MTPNRPMPHWRSDSGASPHPLAFGLLVGVLVLGTLALAEWADLPPLPEVSAVDAWGKARV